MVRASRQLRQVITLDTMNPGPTWGRGNRGACIVCTLYMYTVCMCTSV